MRQGVRNGILRLVFMAKRDRELADGWLVISSALLLFLSFLSSSLSSFPRLLYANLTAYNHTHNILHLYRGTDTEIKDKMRKEKNNLSP